jgi:thioesterase domain-containing protein
MNPESHTENGKLIEPAAETAYLHDEIPLTRAMGMAVSSWDGRTVSLTAPLEPNQNHTDTAFGGAISSLGIMAGYCLVHLLLQERRISHRLLIQKSTIDYLRPIDADMTATACVPEAGELAEFLETLLHKRRARLTLHSQVQCRRMLAATQTGLYVAMLY